LLRHGILFILWHQFGQGRKKNNGKFTVACGFGYLTHNTQHATPQHTTTQYNAFRSQLHLHSCIDQYQDQGA
jgi:hypothetical protein